MPEKAISEVAEEDRFEQELRTRSDLTIQVLLRDQLQKLRIAEGNRARAAERLGDERRMRLHEMYEMTLKDLEERITQAVRDEVVTHPAWPWLSAIHGVAETSAALVVGYIDIHRCGTISQLWRYAGYGLRTQNCENCAGSGSLWVESATGEIVKDSERPERDGDWQVHECATCRGRGFVERRDRPVRGERLPYNARLKTMVWRLIDLQVKTRGPYRTTYDQAKAYYLEHRPDWTKGHVEAAARRKAAKLFLAHLWMVWREAEGLPLGMPYVIDKSGDEHDYIDPWAFIRQREGSAG